LFHCRIIKGKPVMRLALIIGIKICKRDRQTRLPFLVKNDKNKDYDSKSVMQ